MRSIIRHGLKKTKKAKKIIVVGAGMSGLVASSLLKQAGHHVSILEANERIGGRIYTLRSPFTRGLYLEAGAMRIPSTHYLTLEYIRKFCLPIHQFINSTPNDILYANGMKTRLKNYEQNPNILRYPVEPWEKGKTANDLMRLAVQPVLDFIRQNPRRNWDIVNRKFNKYSAEVFLRHNPVGVSLSTGAVEMIKVLLGFEGFPELSFLELLHFYTPFSDPNIHFYEIAGGNDRLPFAFLPELKENIHFSHKMTKIEQGSNYVTIYTTNTTTLEPFHITGDLAIVTIPFSTLNFVEIKPFFSHNKRKAIRELHYVSSGKIGIEFRDRFWEREGQYGGQTVTDLSTRFTYFPSHGFGTGNGVVLASYTWEDDSLIWDSLGEQDRVQEALKNLASIYGRKVYDSFVTGVAYSWTRSPYSAGAFAMFKPKQEIDLSPYLASPEGRVHFAGEHTSHDRAWIQGAIESGIRVAWEVNDLPI